jgi:WD40 repeat protein
MVSTKLTTQAYTFTGTKDGRVFQYLADETQLISRLFSFNLRDAHSKHRSHKNRVRAIANFANILAASAYGGEIILIDISTQANKRSIFKSKSTVSSLMFLNEHKLISANVDGEIHIYNLQNSSVKKLVTTLHKIKQMIYLKESNKLLVSANTNYISLIDLTQEKVLTNKFHSFTDIVDFMELSPQGKLLVSLKNSLQKDIRLNFTPDSQEEISTKLYLSIKGVQKLERAYEENNFTLCYELIDQHKLFKHTLALLLQKHWEKLMHSCEKFALQGDAKSILSTLQELLYIKTRTQKIGDLLRLSFFTKITQLQEEKLYKSATNIIYSYIDIFGFDKEIAKIIQEFEKKSSQKIAIFSHANDRKSRSSWCSYFHQRN